MLCGVPPFFGDNDKDIIQAIKKGNYNFEGRLSKLVPEFEKVSDKCKELIKKMICPYSKRINS